MPDGPRGREFRHPIEAFDVAADVVVCRGGAVFLVTVDQVEAAGDVRGRGVELMQALGVWRAPRRIAASHQ